MKAHERLWKLAEVNDCSFLSTRITTTKEYLEMIEDKEMYQDDTSYAELSEEDRILYMLFFALYFGGDLEV